MNVKVNEQCRKLLLLFVIKGRSTANCRDVLTDTGSIIIIAYVICRIIQVITNGNNVLSVFLTLYNNHFTI